jgi:hypothetical protein
MLLGECKSLNKRADKSSVNHIVAEVMAKDAPVLGRGRIKSREYWIFLPSVSGPMPSLPANVRLISGDRVFDALR